MPPILTTTRTSGLLLLCLTGLGLPFTLAAQGPKANIPKTEVLKANPQAGNPTEKDPPAPVLEITYPDGPLSIRGSSKSKPGWKLPDKLGKGKDTLLVLVEDARGQLLMPHPRAKLKKIDDSASIEIPSAYATRINAGKGGIKLSQLQGKLAGTAQSGSLQMRQVQGQVDFTTKAGTVKVIDSQVSGLVSTEQGDVLLENVEGDLYAFTREGKVTRRYTREYIQRQARTPFVAHQPEGELEVEALPEGGTLRVDQGSIRVGTTRKTLQATAEEGDISIKEAHAGVTATTRQGNITVQVSGMASAEPVTLTASQGDVTVILPGNFSGELQVEILQSDLAKTCRIENAFRGSAARVWPYTQGVPEANQPGAIQTEEVKDSSGKLLNRTIRLQQFLGQGPDPNRRADARRKLIIIHLENGNVKIQKDR